MSLRALRRERGGKARADGRFAEQVAALWLMLRGWRILGFRLKTPHGEIDLLARRGRILAVVEVKSRTSLDAALASVHPTQQARLRRAGPSLSLVRGRQIGRAARRDRV